MTALKNLALLGTGAAAGYLVAVWRFEKRYIEFEALANESIAASNEVIEKLDEATEKLKESDEGLDESRRQWDVQEDGSYSLTEKAEKAYTAVQNYQGMSKKSSTATLVALEPEKLDEDEAGDDDPNDPTIPYIISQEEFAEDDDNTKLTVVYYTGDNIVTDASNTKLPDAYIGKHLSWKNFQKFGDEHYIYVRSEVFREDFEVSRVEGYYAVEVLGHVLPGGDDAA